MIKTCECGNTFEAKRKDRMYCDDCRKKRNVEKVMRSKQKRIPTTQIGVGSGRATNNKQGPENHNWKTGIQGYRRLTPKETCSYCGSKTNLLIHHLDEDRHNNKVENLIVLCKRCHQKHHVVRSATTGRYVKLQTNTEITD